MKLNKNVYPLEKPFAARDASERWTHWCIYAESHGLNEPEYLVPLAQVETEVAPFSYESLPIIKTDLQLQGEINHLKDWNYQMEFANRTVTTRGFRDPNDWSVHRYRGSLLIRNIINVLGRRVRDYSVLDVGCACGLFALEFAHQGCGRVVGHDLREGNIAQAKWLAETYKIPNAEFAVENARNVSAYAGFDIIFCAGLFYHITFPMEFIQSIYNSCTDFVIFDTLLSNHPISTFYLILNRDISYAAEGETSYEFHPTYRVVIDSLLAVGFSHVVEIVGTNGRELGGYGNATTRSFIAFKPGSKSYPLFSERLKIQY
jgi:2-polyprenyl-3-methyl-5-hydroxy-6-metoxy-1,4-benzoquinol methylase